MSTHRYLRPAFGLIVLAAAGTADAQGIATSYDELRLLVRPGDTVSLVQTDGTESRGTILDLSSSSLTLQVKGARVDVPERDVRTIRQRRQDPLGNGALWGFGTGGSFVLLMTVLEGDRPGAAAMLTALMGGGIGAGIGVGVDAMITSRQVIYARPGAAAARISISPLLLQHGHGVRLSLRF